MSRHIEGAGRHQVLLLPEVLDDYVREENPVRFVDAFVDSLDLGELGFTHTKPDSEGRPSYDPADMLKLYIYGYLNQIRTSRKLEQECHRNLEVIWLMKKLAPDFKTIANFRKDNVDCIRKIFREFTCLCKELDLYGGELVGIDGVKLKAVNSIGRNLNVKTLPDKLKHIDEKIESFLKEMEEADRAEEEMAEGQKNERNATILKEKIEKLEEKKREYTNLLSQLQSSGEKEVSLTDQDSRLMKNRGKLEVCYNLHTAVDSKNHLIADYDVSNVAADNNSLSKIAERAKDSLGVETLNVTSDKGFFSADEVKKCVENGITPYIPEPKKSTAGLAKKAGIPATQFYEDKFPYDSETDTYICPAGQRLRFRYWNNKGEGRLVGIYMTDGACFTCPHFMTACTRNKIGRTIQRWEHEEILEEMKRRIKDEPRKVEVRKELCEHPFGTMKRAFNQGYFLLKGLRKVNGEIGFTMLAYNMRRAINILGVKPLMKAIRSY